MICTRCHNQCKDGEQFCHVCGNKLNISTVTGDETTLLESIPDSGEETTLLDDFDNSSTSQMTEGAGSSDKPEIHSGSINPQSTYSYSYPAHEEKKKISTETIVVAAFAVVVVIAIVAVFIFG